MAVAASDIQTVFSLLSNSLSGDESLRKPAEMTLSQYDSRPGFCSCLMEIIAAPHLAPMADVRLLASVYFKNSINRYWRRRRDSPGIGDDEKIHLRKKLLLHMGEENNQIALQLAVLVSKIARIDYPKEWPELFSHLAQQLHSADRLSSYRIFMVLFRTLKELSTKRLTSDQRNFSEITSHFFEYSWRLWQSDVQTIFHGFSALTQGSTANALVEQDGLYIICERWLLCSKILRQLIVCGFPSDAKSVQEVHPVKEVCPAFLNAVQSFLPYYSSSVGAQSRLRDITSRACVKLMKILVTIQGRHPYSFGDKSVLAPLMDFCMNKITNFEPDMVPFEPFLIQCMVMVKSVLECKEYKPSPTGRVVDDASLTMDQMKKNISNIVVDILRIILPDDRVLLLCNVLVQRYFVFTASDLEHWHQNPELFHHEQDMVQWTEKLRPCAEALYIVLFENYRHLLGPLVVSILREAMSGCSASETEITPGMLVKDAAYSAAGHVYYELSNYLNFNEWFDGALSFELSNVHPNMCIIRRKIALVLGQWVSEIQGSRRKPVHLALIRLLQDQDLAVRLAASRSLCFLVEDANFHEEDFIEYLPSCWELCFQLLEDVQEFDSKVQVLNLISVLIEHIGKHIFPFANKMVEFFQKAWEETAGQSLLQIQLLVALRNFVIVLGCQSPVCYNLLLPILKEVIDVNNPDELSLLEDSLLLWEATLSHAPSITSQLLELFPYMVEILNKSFDHLQVSASIIESYIILGGNALLNMHASSMVKVVDLVIGNVNNRGLLSFLPIIEVIAQCFPMEVPLFFGSTIQKLIIICLRGRDECDPSETAVRALAGAILARLLVIDSNYLACLTADPSLSLALQQAGISPDQNVILSLADLWLEKIDDVTPVQRKAYALALSTVLTLRVPEVLEKLDYVLSVCSSVLLAGGDDVNEDSSCSNTSSSVSNSDADGATLSKELKKGQIRASDPIKRFSLEESLRDNLKTCAAFHGDSSFNAAIGRMHPAVFAQLQQALKMA